MVDNCSAEELAYLSTTFAVALAEGLDEEAIRVMCSFFVNVVGNLNLILAQRKLQRERCLPPPPPPHPRPPLSPPAKPLQLHYYGVPGRPQGR